MKSTLDLLEMALATSRSSNALSIELNLGRNTLTSARTRGRLSPILAGRIADRLGQPVAEWIALAALEAEPEMRGCEAIEKLAAKVQKSYEEALTRLRAAVSAHPPQTPARDAAPPA